MQRKDAAKRIDELRRKIRRHDRRYYVENAPSISDAAYDELRRELVSLEEQYPDLVTPDSPTQRVGAAPRSELPKVEHLQPMLSLESVLDPAEAREFDGRVRRGLERESVAYVAEPKFDGLSLELVYEAGVLARAATRGDGQVGEEVTPNARTIPSIPLRLAGGDAPPLLAVRGEALMLLGDFRRLNRRMTELGRSAFANPRNASAGSIRQLDSRVTAERPLTFFAYGIMHIEGAGMPATHAGELDRLAEWGFRVDERRRRCDTIEEAIAFHAELEATRDELPFEIDGVVIGVDDLAAREALGSRSRSPRWSIALKFEPRKEVTTVEEIAVQVGRTGKLTPVALLRPVDVSGVTVSRATLHNAGEVARKDVRAGDQVRIQRAGDVIPAVVERIPRPGEKRAEPFHMPERCPVCGTPVVEEGALHLCPNGLSCPAQLRRGIEHFVSRGALDIDGLGKKTVETFVERGIASSVADLFRLDRDALLELEGFAETSADNLLAAVEAAKRVPLDRFLYALGIRNVGEHLARVLAARFGTLEAVADADEETLLDVHEVGPEVARRVVEFFGAERTRETLAELRELGVEVLPVERAGGPSPLEGTTIVFTGSLERRTREEAKRLVESLGGRASSSVSGKTDYVVAGPGAGSKAEKARELGVPVLTEEEFEEMLGDAAG